MLWCGDPARLLPQTLPEMLGKFMSSPYFSPKRKWHRHIPQCSETAPLSAPPVRKDRT